MLEYDFLHLVKKTLVSFVETSIKGKIAWTLKFPQTHGTYANALPDAPWHWPNHGCEDEKSEAYDDPCE